MLMVTKYTRLSHFRTVTINHFNLVLCSSIPMEADFLQNLGFQLDICIPIWQEKEDFAHS